MAEGRAIADFRVCLAAVGVIEMAARTFIVTSLVAHARDGSVHAAITINIAVRARNLSGRTQMGIV